MIIVFGMVECSLRVFLFFPAWLFVSFSYRTKKSEEWFLKYASAKLLGCLPFQAWCLV